ncbi:MAG: transglycosylase domain-containing protein [Gammaproteobacteria bacterium]|nr:transglycosylase domain-containing protein [Gammaproteobacteria bacterium]
MTEPIKPIRNAADHARVLAEIAALMGAPAGSEQADRLEVLSVLASAYEAARTSVVDCDPVDVLTVAMQAQGRSQAELAHVLGSRSRASEVLKRRRLLSAEMIERIARAWAIPVSLLAAPYDVGRSFRARTTRGLGIGVAALLAVTFAAGNAALWFAGRQVPTVAAIGAWRPVAGTMDVAGAEVPAHVVKAFLAAEDTDFFAHDGLDVSAMLRAAANTMFSSGRQGASTITMQLAKNLFLRDEPPSLGRKLRQVVLARRIETSWSKDRILETYLNVIYFGGNQWGLADASRHYFGVAPADLSVSQAAYLAALPKAPNDYRLDLAAQLPRAKARRDWVLTRMAEDGLITASAAKLAQEEPLSIPAG